MSSTIKLTETIRNADRRFGSADAYIPARVVYADGSDQIALFTTSEIGAATARGRVNPEDCAEYLRRARCADLRHVALVVVLAAAVSALTWAVLP